MNTCTAVLLSSDECVPFIIIINVPTSSTSIDYNDIASPDGYKSASKVTFGAQGIQDYFRFQFTNTANTTYVGSIFLKRGSFDEINVRVSGNAVGMDGQAIFNLANGTFRSELGSVTPKMEDHGNGWYRCSVGDGTNATIASPSFRVSNEGLEPGFVYAWGAQLEAASYPTSYIPTYGSSVTRSAPSLSKYDLIDSTSQTLFIEYGKTGYTGGGGEIIFEKTNPVAAIFRIYLEVDNSGADNSRVRFRTEFPATNNDYNLGNKNEYKKIALSIDGDTAKFFGNGVLLGQFSVTSTVLEQLNVRMQSSKYSTKQLILFPTALTDEECSALTQP